jgi:8-oxo-dGTP pyrophosphatase MutT (NUDIX family)
MYSNILKLAKAYEESTCFAVFVIAPTGGGLYAGTTRAKDRGEGGRIGLPGGKVDLGEGPEEAAIREAAEEGWEVMGPLEVVHTGLVDGRLVYWYRGIGAKKLEHFKEEGRIEPIEVTLEELSMSGYGNEFLGIGLTN